MSVNTNVPLHYEAPVVGVIDPDAYATGDYDTAWIDMANFQAIRAIIFAGTLGSSATIDAVIRQAKTNVGGDAEVMTTTAITSIDASDKIAEIHVRDDELKEGFRYVSLRVTVGTATSDAGAVVLGLGARYQPAADLAAVDEIVGR